MHNVMGMWFTQLALGVSYYAIPRLLGRPVYSYALGVLGFWTNLLFYPLIGAHHFIFSPVPWWLQSTAILFSVGMMVPVWAGTGNLLLTFKGGGGAVRRSYALPFFVTGLIGYGLASTQGTIEAFRTANIYWHFTNFTVGHSHAAMYGFIAFIAWGAVYGLVPRLTGREPRYPLLARPGRDPDLRDLDLGGRSPPGLRVGGRPILHRLGDRGRADVALADDRRSLDGQ